MVCRRAMNKLPRHVKRTFYCEECDRFYSIRYIDRHHRTSSTKITYSYKKTYHKFTTLPKKGLKTRPYSMDMNKEDHTVTLPKKGLKTRPYSVDMNKEDHIVTLPKKGLKTRPYNIGMEKRDLKTRPYNIDMEKKDLKKLAKGQLMNQRKKRNIPPRAGKLKNIKPKPIPRKSINKDIILPPPEQFQHGYRPIPKPRTDRPFQMQNARRPPKPTRKPPPPPIPQVEEKEHITDVPSSKIRELNQAMQNHMG